MTTLPKTLKGNLFNNHFVGDFKFEDGSQSSGQTTEYQTYHNASRHYGNEDIEINTKPAAISIINTVDTLDLTGISSFELFKYSPMKMYCL